MLSIEMYGFFIFCPYSQPNAHLEPVDFDKEFKEFQAEFDEYCNELDFLSYKLYPKDFKDFHNHWKKFGAVWDLPTKAFFFALKQNEEVFVEIGKGKHIIIKMLYIADADENGVRKVYFELNGQTRVIDVRDQNLKATKPVNRKVDGEGQVGAPLQGRIAEVKVKVGDDVKENQALFLIEAMKMETTVSAPKAGKVKAIILGSGDMVQQDDLVIELE
mgnify:FL=1